MPPGGFYADPRDVNFPPASPRSLPEGFLNIVAGFLGGLRGGYAFRTKREIDIPLWFAPRLPDVTSAPAAVPDRPAALQDVVRPSGSSDVRGRLPAFIWPWEWAEYWRRWGRRSDQSRAGRRPQSERPLHRVQRRRNGTGKPAARDSVIHPLPTVVVRAPSNSDAAIIERVIRNHCQQYADGCIYPGDPRYTPDDPEDTRDLPMVLPPGSSPDDIGYSAGELEVFDPIELEDMGFPVPQFSGAGVSADPTPKARGPLPIGPQLIIPVLVRLILREIARRSAPDTTPQRAPQPVLLPPDPKLGDPLAEPDLIALPEIVVRPTPSSQPGRRVLPSPTPLPSPRTAPVVTPSRMPFPMPSAPPLPSPATVPQRSPQRAPSTTPGRSPATLPGSRPGAFPFNPSRLLPFLPLALPALLPSGGTTPLQLRGLTPIQGPGVGSAPSNFAQAAGRPAYCPPCGPPRNRAAEKRKRKRRECQRSVTRDTKTGRYTTKD